MKGIMKKALIIAISASMLFLCFGSVDSFAKARVKHNVTFIYGLKSVTVPVVHGKNAPIPTDTDVPGFTFTGWVGNAANVTEDRVILGAYVNNNPAPKTTNAGGGSFYSTNSKKFTSNKSAQWPAWWSTLNLPKGVPGKTCAVHWFNEWTGELWRTDIVPYGSSIATPPDPCIGGYEFSGWDGDWTNITEDRAIGATYFINHTITFCDPKDEDDYIEKVRVRDGEGAWIKPSHHDGYKFVGYKTSDGSDYDGGGVHDDITVYAQYEEDK